MWETIGQTLGEDFTSAEPDEARDEVQMDSTTVKARPTASTGRRLADEKKRTPTRGVTWAEAAAD